MDWLDIVRWVHIGGGTLALLTLCVPLVTRKGGRLHRIVGWTYVGAMVTVSLSATAISLYRLGFDADADSIRRSFALFLLFIAVLTGASLWFGLRVLRLKRRTGPHNGPIDLGVALLLVAAGLSVAIKGVVERSILLATFPLIGVFLGRSQLRYWRSAPGEKQHWWFAHMSGMFASCISAITAFLVVGAPRLFGDFVFGPIVWFAPTMVLVPMLLLWQRRYRRQFSRT